MHGWHHHRILDDASQQESGGIITSWNRPESARLYRAGGPRQAMSMLIRPERSSEEPAILARIGAR